MRRLHLLIGLFVGLAVLWAAGFDVVSGDEPETVTTVLQPGDNFVGWVDERTPIYELFDELPQIELVYTYKNQWWGAQYHFASPLVPPSLWNLLHVEPGEGYVFRVREAVQWERSWTPVTGLIELRQGANWVTWMGKDDWSIADVAKGIGTALQEIRRGDLTYAPSGSQSENEWPPIMRGDALEVFVSRNVNWLQPTLVLPDIKFLGPTSDAVKARVNESAHTVLSHFASEYSVGPDPADLTVLVPRSVEDLIAHYESESDHEHGPEVYVGLRNFWNKAAGWAGRDEVVVKQEFWRCNDCDATGLLAHELFHILQHQWDQSFTHVPTWIVEGTAEWADSYFGPGQLTEISDHGPRLDVSELAAKGPTLESTSEGNGTWQYVLGLAAIQQLAARAGTEAPVEFYRSLVSTSFGPNDLWSSSQGPLGSAFEESFGISLDDFYEEFETWQGSLPGRATYAGEQGDRRITGLLRWADGEPIGEVWLTATQIQESVPVGWSRRAETDEQGRFEVFVPGNSANRLRFNLHNGSCSVWYATNGAVSDHEHAELVSAQGATVDLGLVAVEGGLCRYTVSGRVVGPDGEPLPRLELQIHSQTRGLRLGYTDDEGYFEIAALEPGRIELGVGISGLLRRCTLWYTGQEDLGPRTESSLIDLSRGSVTGIVLRASHEQCSTVVRGRVLQGPGMEVEDIGVLVANVEESNHSSTRVSADGRFEVVLLQPGMYYVVIDVRDCRVYDGPDGIVFDRNQASMFSVAPGNIIQRIVRLPDSLCDWLISGRVRTVSGKGVGTYLSINRTTDGHSSQTFSDQLGYWHAEVAGPGTYTLSARWGITGCFRTLSNSVESVDAEWRIIDVGGGAVVDVEFVLPDDWCQRYLEGVLLDGGGRPTEGVEVYAHAKSGSGRGRTDADGKFRVRVPGGGSYEIRAWTDGCGIYMGDSGPVRGRHDAKQISVSNADVTGIEFRLPEDPSTFCN